MERSPLARLPAELRNDIYELVLQAPNTIEVVFTEFGTVRARNARLALTATCYAIRSETLTLYYSLNHFVLQTGYLSTVRYSDWQAASEKRANKVLAWIRDVGLHNIVLAKDITVNLGCAYHAGDVLICDSDRWGEALRVKHSLCSPFGPLMDIRRFRFQICMGVPALDEKDDLTIQVRFYMSRTREVTEQLWSEKEVTREERTWKGAAFDMATFGARIGVAVKQLHDIVLHPAMWGQT